MNYNKNKLPDWILDGLKNLYDYLYGKKAFNEQEKTGNN